MKQNFNNPLSHFISSTFLSSSRQTFIRPYPVSQKGFSFIEVLMVMVIIGIMSTIAVPNMSAMMKSYRLKSAANDLASTLQLARLTAISQNANSVVTFNLAAQSYSAFSDNGEGGGTLNDGTQSGTEPTIKTLSVLNEYGGEITLGTPTFGLNTFFTGQGSCKENGSGSIVLQNNSGESYRVDITRGGSIKVVKQ